MIRHLVLPSLALAATVCSGTGARASPPVSHRDKLYDAAVVTGNLYIVGYPGLLLRSTDGARHFEPVPLDLRQALFAIDFAADGTGAIVGRSGLVLVSADGGATWRRVDSGTEEHLFDVAVAEGGRIWAVGHFGTIVHSADGGKRFASQRFDARLPQRDGLPASLSTAEAENEGAAEEARLNGVSFSDPQHGFIVGEFGLVLRTEDGGKRWSRQRGATGRLLLDVFSPSPERAIAVGAEGTIMHTRDGGARWTLLASGVHEHLLAVAPAGDQLLIVGRDGMALRLHSMEDKMAPQRSVTGVYAWLSAVAFLDARRGVVVGGRGHLLLTEDGGRSFIRIWGK